MPSINLLEAEQASIEFLEIVPSPEKYPLIRPLMNDLSATNASVGTCFPLDPLPTHFVKNLASTPLVAWIVVLEPWEFVFVFVE